MAAQGTFLDDMVFVSEYLDEEDRYQEALKSPSEVPFSVDLGNGERVFYYLCTAVDRCEAGKIALKMHNCRACKDNVARIAGLFGPSGYALSFGGPGNAGRLYNQLEDLRERSKDDIDQRRGFFIVSQENLSAVPQKKGLDKGSGEPFTHLSLNLWKHLVTNDSLARRITRRLLDKLHDGSMDGTLSKIITTLQSSTEIFPKSHIEAIKATLDNPELLRKHMWDYRIKFVEDIQQFAKEFNRTTWEDLSEAEKMQVRIYALFYKGSFTPGVNATYSIFEAAKTVTDIAVEAESMDAIVPFMNSRTDPTTYMVQQVADKVERHGVTSRFKVALAWESTTDAWVVINETGEALGYSNMVSRDRNTRLDFDANAGNPTTRPVENFTLSDKSPGTYHFYVNNYHTRGNPKSQSNPNHTSIDFTVVVNLDGEVSTIADSWDVVKRGENSHSIIGRMMYMTTIDITQEMIDKKVAPEMSVKQANRFQHLRPKFEEIFGEVKSEIVDLDHVEGAVMVNGKGYSGTSISVLDRLNLMALASKEKAAINQKKTGHGEGISSPNNLGDIIRSLEDPSYGATIYLRGRDYPPSYLTRSSCAGNLTADIQVNVYYEEGRAPRQPDPNAAFDNCRFDRQWCEPQVGGMSGEPVHDVCMRVAGILPLKHNNYDGYFLAVDGGRLPEPHSRKWVVAGGMYPTDLRSEFHVYRELWQLHHTMIRPSMTIHGQDPAIFKCGGQPGIGVFLHKDKEYPLVLNGEEITLKA